MVPLGGECGHSVIHDQRFVCFCIVLEESFEELEEVADIFGSAFSKFTGQTLCGLKSTVMERLTSLSDTMHAQLDCTNVHST